MLRPAVNITILLGCVIFFTPTHALMRSEQVLQVPSLFSDVARSHNGHHLISPKKALQRAEKIYGGKALPTPKLVNIDGQLFYRVKLIKKGRIKVVRIKARH